MCSNGIKNRTIDKNGKQQKNKYVNIFTTEFSQPNRFFAYPTIGAWLLLSFTFFYASTTSTQAQITSKNDSLKVIKQSQLRDKKQTLDKTITLKGQVVDENEEPIPGATILIKNTTTGTTANIDGYFNLNVKIGDTIIVRCSSFTSRRIKIEKEDFLKVVLK
ncbi:MAG: hypothetical protein EAZ55_00830 [Cytophagales bacterium]|nr:MAG: hypothetical protein EAZ55_00830 [Cytophagales bacterium]